MSPTPLMWPAAVGASPGVVAPPLVASRERGSARPQSLRALRTATGPVRSTCHGLLDVTSGRVVRMSASVAASAIESRCNGVSFDALRISERARRDEHSVTETTNSASRMSMRSVLASSRLISSRLISSTLIRGSRSEMSADVSVRSTARCTAALTATRLARWLLTRPS